MTSLKLRLTRALLVAVLASAGILGVGASPADAEGSRIVTQAEAESTAADQFDFDSEVQVRTMHGNDPGSPGNYASAWSHDCQGCQAAAFSIQVVLASGGAQVGSPENLAVALNERCDGCDTVADAHQFIVVSAKPLRFTEKGKRVIDQARWRVWALRYSGLDGPTMVARVQVQADQVQAALLTELRPADDDDDDGPERARGDVTEREHTSVGGGDDTSSANYALA